MAPVITVEDVIKRYRRVSAGYQLRTLKSALLGGGLARGLGKDDVVEALSGVSFEVAPGDSFGVIGGNGSGKSTLLKILSGLLKPTKGKVSVNGRVAALIELGAGFHPEISGRENIFINGAVLGLSKKQIEERYERIVAFSGLADFIEEPVKNYSSGMYVRLGFSVAIHTDPEILLVDEVLAVGDEAFGRQCIRRIEEHLADGNSLLLVSHSLDLVEEVCSRVLWLDRGHVMRIGEPREVIDAYRQFVAESEGARHLEEKEAASPEDADRWGSGAARINEARLEIGPEGAGEEGYVLESGTPVSFVLEAQVAPNQAPLEDFVFGILVQTPRGVECWGTNTELAGLEPESFSGKATVRLHCPALRLSDGEYTVDVAVHARDGTPYDYRRNSFSFTVRSSARGVGIYSPEHHFTHEGDVAFSRPRTKNPSNE